MARNKFLLWFCFLAVKWSVYESIFLIKSVEENIYIDKQKQYSKL